MGRMCLGIVKYFQQSNRRMGVITLPLIWELMGSYKVFSGQKGEHIFRFVTLLDVTYKTNKFKMPFALFTSVNQHL